MYQVCRSPSGKGERPAFVARVEVLAAQIEEREAASSSPPTEPLSAAHPAHATSHSSPPPTSSPSPTSSPPLALPPQPAQQAPLAETLGVPWRGRGRRQWEDGRSLAPHAIALPAMAPPQPLPPQPLPPQPLPQQQTEPLLCAEADTVPESDAPVQQQLLQALLVAELGPEQQRLLEALHCRISRVNTDAELSVCLGSPTCVARLLLLASDAELMSGGDQVRLPTAVLTMALLSINLLSLHSLHQNSTSLALHLSGAAPHGDAASQAGARGSDRLAARTRAERTVCLR